MLMSIELEIPVINYGSPFFCFGLTNRLEQNRIEEEEEEELDEDQNGNSKYNKIQISKCAQ